MSALLATTYSSTIVTKLGDGISLVDRVVQKPFRWFDSVKSDLSHLTRTYNENESLKKQIYQLEVKSNEAESLKTENEQLRKLLDMKSKLQATKTLAADIIMRSPVSWQQELTLDAGKSKGASENMLAIANGGLIGSVSKVEDNSTRVNLLTNTEMLIRFLLKFNTALPQFMELLLAMTRKMKFLKLVN